MDIDTAAGQLRVHFPKGAQVVGAHEKMTDPSEIFKVFQLIKIVLKVPPAGGLRQVVRLIHNDRNGPAIKQCRFHRFSQFAFPNSGNLAINERIV